MVIAPLPLPALGRLSVAGCKPFPALITNGRVRPLASIPGLRGAESIDALLANWSHDESVLAKASAVEGAPLDEFRIHAPLTPSAVYCTIGNYRAQLVEAALDADADADIRALHDGIDRRRLEGTPYIVSKALCSVGDPFATLPVDPALKTLDWEVEIGAVIGRHARNVDVDQALAHVAGYCTVNDITLRERLFRTDPKAMGTDFLQAKGGPGWLPVGPWLVPLRHVPEPTAMRLSLKLNGQTMQDDVAADMVFSIAEQVAYLSRHVELRPGDLICTGSPKGFGSHHRRYIRPGDVVEAGVDALGTQRIEAGSAA